MYRKSKRSRTLVGKNGVITTNSKKNVQNLINSINNNENYSDAEKRTLINDLKARVMQAHADRDKLTVNGFFARYEEDKIMRMLTNAGYSPEELANEIGVTEDDILNHANWKGDIFMGAWQLQFQYTGELLKHI